MVSSSRTMPFLLQCCILLSTIGILHAFANPVRPSTISRIGLQDIHKLQAVKKSFDRNLNNSNERNTKPGLMQRLRIQRRKPDTTTLPQKQISPATTYIPSGMTLEEYNNIKKSEAIEESTKNYGAWGPRFKQGERPEGDWMVLPQLWTSGAVDGPLTTVNANGQPVALSPLQRLGQKVPSVILATVLLDSILTAITMYQAATVDWRKMLAVAFRLPLFLLSNINITKNWKQVALLQFSKLHVVKAMVVLATAPILDHYYLNRVNRYRLWSKRRTVTFSTLGSMGVLALWALALGTMKRVGFL